MSRLEKTLMIFVMLLVFIGCSTTQVTKMYFGHERPKDQVAILKGGMDIILSAVDGEKRKFTAHEYKQPLMKRASLYVPRQYKGFEVHLLPGTHKVEFAIWYEKIQTEEGLSFPTHVLEFDAKPGHVYLLYYLYHDASTKDLDKEYYKELDLDGVKTLRVMSEPMIRDVTTSAED